MFLPVILDEIGAESLLGKGDMLIKGVGLPLQRAHGYFIQVKEIEGRLTQQTWSVGLFPIFGKE